MHQVALVAVTTEISLGVATPTIGAEELLELLELFTLMLELLLPEPVAAELEELLLSEPPHPPSASVTITSKPMRKVCGPRPERASSGRPRARLRRIMRSLH
jgi:hypothetical protein